MSAQSDEANIRFYSDDLLPDLQHTLAGLADIETRYEIERDHLVRWAGSGEVKDRLLAELEQCYRANRERLCRAWKGCVRAEILNRPPRGGPITDEEIGTFEP